MSTPRRVWFLILPRTGILDVAGPWEVFGHANDVLGRVVYQLTAFGAGSSSASTRYGLVLGGLRRLPRGSARLPDVALVPGAPVDPAPGEQDTVVAWLRRQGRRIPTLVSICTGAFVLGAAGALDGRRVTTHWMFLPDLAARFPQATVVDDGVYVRSVDRRGELWTSAGVSAGIDLTLALVERDHGREVAMEIAKRMVLFLRRSGAQAQFSSALLRQGREPAELRDITAFVLEHVDRPLPVERVARAAGMSARSFSRWCRRHLGESPAGLVRGVRVDEARRLLEATDLPLKAVAVRTGLGDASTLWRAFSRQLGVTPARYRQRFHRGVERASVQSSWPAPS